MAEYDVSGQWQLSQTNGAVVEVHIDPLRSDRVFAGTATHNNGSVSGAGFGSLNLVNANEFTFTIGWSDGTRGAYIGAFDGQGFLHGATFDVNHPDVFAGWQSVAPFSPSSGGPG